MFASSFPDQGGYKHVSIMFRIFRILVECNQNRRDQGMMLALPNQFVSSMASFISSIHRHD